MNMNKYRNMNYRELKRELDYHTKIKWQHNSLQYTIWNAGLDEDHEAMINAKRNERLADECISKIKEVMYSGLPK